MKIFNLIIQIIVIFGFTAFSQDKVINPGSSIPVDPYIIKGKLKNGLTYYIRENGKPSNRVEMRLVVNAGSLQEDDDQQGLAHFVEHMCFNGTKHFEKNELVNFLEKTGVQFGADLNAYTSFDETVYKFQIPTTRETLIDTGLMVLKDWAAHVSFEDEEIDKERGVIIEEWRLGLGAQDRMMKKYLPVVLKGSRYEKRLPIGKIEIIRNFEYKTLKRFYNDWYRPDLMAVIVVGDIEKTEMEQKIMQTFSGLTMPDNPRKRKKYDIPDNEDPLISIVTDPEATYNTIQLMYKHDKKPELRAEDYRRLLMYQLYNGMIGHRLNEIIQQPDAPFIYASANYGGFLGRSKDAYTSFAACKDNKIKESLRVILSENEKVKRFGFTQTEMDRQKKDILTFYEKALNELGKTESRVYAQEYIRNFLDDEPIPGIEKENEYAEHFIPGIGLEEVNTLAKEWIIDHNQVIISTAPEKEELQIPSKEDFIEILKESEKMKVSAYVDEVSDEPLISELPRPGKITEKIHHKDFDYYEFVLDNGTEVYVKETDFQNDQVLFSSHSFGGKSLYGLEDNMSASFAANIINLSGLGSFDNIALQKKLAGNTASVSPWIGRYSEGTKGNSSPKDFETLLQLNYLYFTSARKDTQAFESFKQRLENQVKYMKDNPRMAYSDTLVKTINSNNPRYFAIPTREHIESLELEKAFDIYTERFTNAGDFKFFIVGNIDPDTISALLEKYIGGLPSINKTEKWKDIDADFPEKSKEVYLKKGLEQQSLVSIVMNDDMTWKEKERLHLHMMMQVLSIKLRESLREDQGGTYGVSARESLQRIPAPEYTIKISFGCSPEKIDTLIESVFNEMEKIKAKGPEAEDLQKVKEIMISNRETNDEKNNFWLQKIQSKHIKEGKIYTIEQYKSKISEVTRDDIKRAANTYLNTAHYVKVVLLPEKTEDVSDEKNID